MYDEKIEHSQAEVINMLVIEADKKRLEQGRTYQEFYNFCIRSVLFRFI